MAPIKQLLRQPIRTVAALILLTASAAFLCLGWGVFRSARATREAVEESFVTLARFGPAYSTSIEYDLELNTQTGSYVEINPREVIRKSVFAGLNDDGTVATYNSENTGILRSDLWDALRSSGNLRGIYQQQFMSARVPGLRTVTSAPSGTRYNFGFDEPYNRAVLIFTLTDFEVEEVDDSILYGFPEGTVICCKVTMEGELTGYPALHPDYAPRGRVQFSRTISPLEDWDAVLGELEIGGTYIVNASQYRDEDLYLRGSIIRSMASQGYTVEDVDLSKIVPTVGAEKEIAEYVYDDMDGLGFGKFLDEYQVEMVDRCSVSLPPELTSFGYDAESGTLTSLNAALPESVTPVQVPIMARITGSLEDFLADPDNADWAALLSDVRDQYSTVPVIGTDLLKSLYLFHENIAYVAQGRSFESADYAQGRRVCLISEALAQANGLEVGDTISLELYNNIENSDNRDRYYAQFLYESTEFQDTREYEIIGLYTNTDQWGQIDGNLTPDTVFVPAASLEGLDTRTTGDFLKGIVVQNGSVEALTALFAEKGWPEDLLVFFDGGYAQISDTMAGFMDSPRQLLLVAAAAFIVILAAYIALFVSRQRRNAGLMRSLGAGRGRVGWFVFVTSAVPAALSCFVGAALGMLLLERVLDRVLGETLSGVAGYANMVKALPSSVVAVALAMLLADLLILGFVSAWTARRRPLRLLKK